MKLEYTMVPVIMSSPARIWGKIAFGEQLFFCEGPDRIGLNK